MAKKSPHHDHWEMVKRLISARRHSKLTQIKAAKLLGMTQGNLSQIENGRQRLAAIELIKFAKAYKKPIHFFYE